MSSFYPCFQRYILATFTYFSDSEGKDGVAALFEKVSRSTAMKMVKANASVNDIEKLFLFVVDVAKAGWLLIQLLSVLNIDIFFQIFVQRIQQSQSSKISSNVQRKQSVLKYLPSSRIISEFGKL